LARYALIISLFTGCLPLTVAAAEATPEALADPVSQQILPGELSVRTEEFVRLPQTADSASPPQTNQAYARIQYLSPLPDDSGRLVINDLRGLLYLTDERGSDPVLYIDLHSQDVDFDDTPFPNEMGLAGVAFHTDFGDQGEPGYGKFYTAYSAPSDSGEPDYLGDEDENHHSVIREWTADDPDDNVFSGTSREIFRVGQFAQNHNIGTLAFDPAARRDTAAYGLLYASFGDGGAANDPNENGQDLSNPLSSIIRIDPLGGSNGTNYGIPADNPFVDTDGAAPEIWAYGLRHPQHFSFDSRGRLFIADIGQAQIEEVNLGARGANYGWRIREGTFATAFEPAFAGGVRPNPVYPRPADTVALAYPVAQFDHGEGNAISSVFLYEGDAIPRLRGKLVFTDMVSGRIFYSDGGVLPANGSANVQELQILIDGTVRNLADAIGFPNTYSRGNRAGIRLGTDSNGELYLLSKGDGWVRKLLAP
ncbi:MAG: PQQ-dependent sugar dehydrogenase, partial [Gammaproteobacteria bacterium]